MNNQAPSRRVAPIPGLRVQHVSIEGYGNGLIRRVHAVMDPLDHVQCPACGTKGPVKPTDQNITALTLFRRARYRPKYLDDIPVDGVATRWTISRYRYLCRKCRREWCEPIPETVGFSTGSVVTHRLVRWIRRQIAAGVPISHLTVIIERSAPTVIGYSKRVIPEETDDEDTPPPVTGEHHE